MSFFIGLTLGLLCGPFILAAFDLHTEHDWYEPESSAHPQDTQP